MTEIFVASFRDTKRSWAVNVVYVTFLQALCLSFGMVVLTSSQDVAVGLGGDINITCTLRGPNISWSEIPGGNASEYDWLLTIFIKNITKEQAGTYTCHNSTLVKEQHNVTVKYGAVGTISNGTQQVNLGETLQISCEVDAVPPVTEITWFLDNKSLNTKGKNLRIVNVNCSHGGIYICRPNNSIGNAKNGTAEVTVRGCPLPIQDNVSVNHMKADAESHNDTVNTDMPTESTEAAAVPIALGVVLGILLVTVAIGAYFVLRRQRFQLQCCCSAYCNGFFSVENDPNPSPKRRTSLISVSKLKRGEIPLDDFAPYVKFLHTDGDYRFNQEFESLKNVNVKRRTWLHSDKAENQAKNRYGNIVAYDHSRVILSLTENEPDSHYINANYVDSFEKGNAYIATQGPMANTINDFWRMVWEQNCTVVVMITNIIEKGRHKCAMYWPSRQVRSEVHGPLKITYLDEEAFAFYTVRRFEVAPVHQNSHYCQDITEDEVKPMIVSQYHFTGWPDHGAPDTGCEYPALSFILKSAAASQDGAGPIIVHCSAGVGRSGAYIVIHSMVKRMHVTGDVNIYDFLSHIRQQRNHLVQEECQYIFVHDSLVHYIDSGFKLAVPSEDLKDHVQKLRKNMSSQSGLDVEFENLNAVQIKNYNLKQAKRGCNIAKNRSVDYIPADTARVELCPRPREEGSDYINASYLPGFWKSEAYIATQYPLEDTTDDFWRMVWQDKCRSLIMLVSKAELEQAYYHSYLPPAYETRRFGEYEVTVDSMETRGDIVVRELRMASIKDPSEYRNVRHFHFLHWPEDGNPWSGQTILQLICKVDSWEKEVRVYAKPFEEIGPILVHCNYGVGRTGVYCILHTMYHQLARENTVSIYQMARLYNFKRPHCILCKGQYEFCYDTLVEYIEADCSLHLV